jgi:hypothetical protein
MIVLSKKILNYQRITGNLILLLIGLCLMLPAQSESFSYIEKENNQSFRELQTKEIEKDVRVKIAALLTNPSDQSQFVYDQNKPSFFQNKLTAQFNFYSWSQGP